MPDMDRMKRLRSVAVSCAGAGWEKPRELRRRRRRRRRKGAKANASDEEDGKWRASFSPSVRTTGIRTERLAVWYRLTD